MTLSLHFTSLTHRDLHGNERFGEVVRLSEGSDEMFINLVIIGRVTCCVSAWLCPRFLYLDRVQFPSQTPIRDIPS
jgi:hypothetical protein